MPQYTPEGEEILAYCSGPYGNVLSFPDADVRSKPDSDAAKAYDAMCSARIANAPWNQAEREDAKAAAMAQALVTARAEYPELLPVEGMRFNTKHAAVNIRRALKNAFPGVKFSVRTSYGSCTSSIDVSWTDGPTLAEVEPLADRHQHEDFDGMTDSSNFRTGVAVNAFFELFGSTRFVFCRRDFSDAAIEHAISVVSRYYGSPDVPTVADYRSGGIWGKRLCNGGDRDAYMRAIHDCLELRQAFNSNREAF